MTSLDKSDRLRSLTMSNANVTASYMCSRRMVSGLCIDYQYVLDDFFAEVTA